MKREKGAAMVEYGLSLLLFLTVVYAIMEFGRFIYSYNVLAGATREGARYAIVHGSQSGALASSDMVQNEVRRWAIGLNTSSITVTTTWPSGFTRGQTVLVKSTYPLTPMTGFIYQSAINVGSQSQMVISQ
jgi:Flp pilus assembly protein TadG